MADNITIEEIHNNFVNGNHTDAVRLIHRFDPAEFFYGYPEYLKDNYEINSNSWGHLALAIRMFTLKSDCKRRI